MYFLPAILSGTAPQCPHWPVCCVPWLSVVVHAWCPVMCTPQKAAPQAVALRAAEPKSVALQAAALQAAAVHETALQAAALKAAAIQAVTLQAATPLTAA